MSTEIHPSAIVHPGAELGEGVIIGPFTVIGDKVKIGDRSVVDASAQINEYTTLGKENHVHSYASVGDAPQDLKYQGEKTELIIGDRNRIREFTTLNRGTAEGGGITRIGSDCFVMAYAHVAHDCQLGDNIVLANAATLAGHVHIGNNAVIGGLSAVHQFSRVGDYAFVGGKTGVVQDVPPYMLAAGERAQLRGPNLIGLRRAGFSRDEISGLKKAFKIFWRSGQKKQDAVSQIKAEITDNKLVQNLLDFIASSERGMSSAMNSDKS